jgi:hypothetical protein
MGNKVENVHKIVSELVTPRTYVEDKMGIDYVKYPYMRSIADKYYPGWSWKIISTEIVDNKAFIVHGRLSWHEAGTPIALRHGDVTAGHRIQYSKKDPTEFVDLGNDAKAANTDCIKKAFNMYLNISDDVYRAQVKELDLTDEQKDKVISLAKELNRNDIVEMVNNGKINGINYDACVAKLNREKENK